MARRRTVPRRKPAAKPLGPPSTPAGERVFIDEMFRTLTKISEGQMDRGDLKLINSALKELRYAIQIFSPYRSIRKAAVFGSARTGESHPLYHMARDFSAEMARRGWMIITGGAGGIMGAAQEGAGRDNSFGVNIILPSEQSPNRVIAGDHKLIHFRYFFTRKLIFLKESDATVLFPGGFGTLDEGYESLTLVQTGKAAPRPIVLIDQPDGSYWQTWQAFTQRELTDKGMVSDEDSHLVQRASNIQSACDIITRFYRNYHSQRFVKDELVMRLQQAPSARRLAQLEREFADIIVSGGFRVMSPLPEETDETALRHLPRLVFHFNRLNYGRLKLLIDRLNE